MANTADRQSVLILGGPNTGKSHYAWQLYGRLQVGGCELSLRKTPENSSLFESGLDRLNQGLAGEHTSTNTYLECTLPLLLPPHKHVDVSWPDYGGEQLFQQIRGRRINEAWRERLVNSNSWILFVRPTISRRHKDIIADPIATELPNADEVSEDVTNTTRKEDDLSPQATIVEMLQILLHVAGIDVSKPTRLPVLGVIISCWDELGHEDDVTPENSLIQHAPLVHQFIVSNWKAERHFIVGLSSTEKPLSNVKPDQDFVQNGPESFGYTIGTDGKKNLDLTLPISILLNLTRSNAR